MMNILETASITISVITTAALITSIVIYYKQYKEMKKQNESLQEQVKIMKLKPELKLEFDYSTVDKPVPIISNTKVGEAKLVRVKVSNNGDTTARECIAKAEIIRNGRTESFGGVLLHWIRYWEGVYTDIKEQFKPLDIARGDYEIADLIAIDKVTQKISLMPAYHIPEGKYSVIRCNRNPALVPIDDRAKVKAGDLIRVNVYCDNITSRPVCLKLLKDPDYDAIKSDNINEFFEETECPEQNSYFRSQGK